MTTRVFFYSRTRVVAWGFEVLYRAKLFVFSRTLSEKVLCREKSAERVRFKRLKPGAF